MSEGKIILEPGEDFKAAKNPSGHILIDGKVTCDTIQCKHCGHHYISVKGSGKLRGYCTKCNGWLCGAPACLLECSHFEKKLEQYEKGKINILI